MKFKKTPAKVEGAKLWGMGKVGVKNGKFIVTPIKRKGVNVGKKRRVK